MTGGFPVCRKASLSDDRKIVCLILNAGEPLSVWDGVTSNPVTVTVAYRVMPGRSADFHAWGWAMLGATARQPGFLGGGVLVDGGAEWHVVYRFASEGSALAWEKSVTRAQWDARLDGVAREAERRRVRGARAWFDAQTLTPAPPAPPSKWKLWFVNMSAVFPPVLLFNLTVLPYLGDLNALLRSCCCVWV